MPRPFAVRTLCIPDVRKYLLAIMSSMSEQDVWASEREDIDLDCRRALFGLRKLLSCFSTNSSVCVCAAGVQRGVCRVCVSYSIINKNEDAKGRAGESKLRERERERDMQIPRFMNSSRKFAWKSLKSTRKRNVAETPISQGINYEVWAKGKVRKTQGLREKMKLSMRTDLLLNWVLCCFFNDMLGFGDIHISSDSLLGSSSTHVLDKLEVVF